MASKRDEMFAVETYLDDGFPGYFMDCASYIGYALLEHYICSDLCNARYSISFAGLLSEIDTRIAIPLALHRLMSTEEQPVMSYINGSTNMTFLSKSDRPRVVFHFPTMKQSVSYAENISYPGVFL